MRTEKSSRGVVRQVGVSAAAAAAALMILDACSNAAGTTMMRVGDTLSDAGRDLIDAGGDGALAEAGQVLVEAGSALADAGARVEDAGATGTMAQAVTSLFKSGSRIEFRVTRQNGADGSVSAGYPTPFDTQLGTDCTIVRSSDSKSRCLPIAGNAAVGYFADVGCTQKLAFVAATVLPGCSTPPAPSYAMESIATACQGVVYTLYALAEEYSGSVFFRASSTSCTNVSNAVSQYRFYRLGAEVPPSRFVEFTDGDVVKL